MKKIVLSGMRPTGALHLGHIAGALRNWIKLQDKYECYYSIVSWHALSSEYKKYLYAMLDIITELNPNFEHPYII